MVYIIHEILLSEALCLNMRGGIKYFLFSIYHMKIWEVPRLILVLGDLELLNWLFSWSKNK